MPTAEGNLTEPHVLAQAKRRLFPDNGATDTYAVVDTQFASGQWLAEKPIDSSTKEALAPFNHVRVGSGYPDLVGVRTLDSEFVATDQRSEQLPLVIVEAKGYTEQGSVDIDQGVKQPTTDCRKLTSPSLLRRQAPSLDLRERSLAN